MEVFPDSGQKWDVNDQVQCMLEFTKTYQKHENEHIAVREVKCLEAQYPWILLPLQEEDLFAGRLVLPAINFSPQADGNDGGFAYVASPTKIQLLLDHTDVTVENKEVLKELSEFWKTRNSTFKTREAYPEHLKNGLPSDNWTQESGIAFPLYRMSGTHLNYKKLLQKGIKGLIAELEQKKVGAGTDTAILFAAMQDALVVFQNCCEYYAQNAEKQVDTCNDVKRKKELMEMAEVLRAIKFNRPQSFREAIQLFFLYNIVSGSQNYGRIDDFLGEYYVNDITLGKIKHDEALRFMKGLWKLMIARDAAYDGRAVVGGKGRENEETADQLALLAIETAGEVIDILPQLTLRFYEGQNPKLLEKSLEVIGKGSTFPMLYNDDVNISSVQKSFGVDYEDAEQYLPFGCGEYVLYHRSVGTPSSVLNLLKALEVTIFEGVDPVSGKKMGIPKERIGSLDSFESLYGAYKQQVEYYVDLLAEQEEIEYIMAGKEAPCLYFSMLYDDCVEKGKGIFGGGVKHLGGTEEIYGFTNTSDSLLSIRMLVYEKEIITLSNLRKAILANFEGYEQIRKQLFEVPKYGNDNAEADEMAVMVHDHVCNYTRSQKYRTGLDSFLVVNINNDANTTLGRYTSASADGRMAYQTMSNGNSPMMAMDKNGVTALLNSMAKINTDNHAGAVQNIKFSKEMFGQYLPQLKALLKSYFDKGGAQLMITTVGKNELEQAMKNPDEYKHIVVRIGGFSAKFVELNKEVQNEILTRTLY